MKVCAVVLDGGKVRPNTKRDTYDSFGFLGLEMILDDVRALGIEPEYVTPEYLHQYDYALWSITAPEDIPVFLRRATTSGMHKGNCRLIVGGAGCINITSIYDYIDAAVFGRGEGLIGDVLEGKDHESVWYKDKDPGLEGIYLMRQVHRLSPLESSCGCKRKCFFCQYTWTRKKVGDNYNAALKHGPQHNINEEDLASLTVDKPGRYTSAFDGLSATTRKRINKGFVTDSLICSKFEHMMDVSARHNKAVMLKIFNIVGYPWESVASINSDIAALGDLFFGLCKGKSSGRVMAAIHSTPFSPEPLTPMQLCPANIRVNWRQAFGGRCKAIIRNQLINVFLDPYTNSPPTLTKRVLVNRCRLEDRTKIVKVLSGNKLEGQRGEAIHKSVSDYLARDIFGQQSTAPAWYLQTYADVAAIGAR